MRVYELQKGSSSIEGLRRAERPDPQAGPRQVLIRIRAASLNYRDHMALMGIYFTPVERPTIPLSDGAGEVGSAGAGVTRFHPGDRVAGTFLQVWKDGPRPPRVLAAATIESMYRTLLLLLIGAGLRAATPCPQPRDVPAGTQLQTLSVRYFGSSRYAISVALATNSRTAEGFRYIANPDDLTGIPRVCIPSKSEARELERSWQAYTRAVDAARLPRMSEINNELVIIPPDQPVHVVAWMRKDQADRLKTASGEWISSAPSDTWVTVENYLQEFCRRFVSEHRPDETKLTRRLEQRLGLAPASSKTSFVRMQLDHPGPEVIFRPCVDPAADHPGCTVGPPSKAVPAYQQWFYQQYYSSYGQSLISEFPWTSLGYTFDWAPAPKTDSGFVRRGESEFVVHKDASIKILDAVTTTQYCAP